MNKEELTQKLNKLFESKINYEGEFDSLFIIERDMFSHKVKINFLNKQHFNFIMKHFNNELTQITENKVLFRYLNLKTNTLTLKSDIEEVPQIIHKKREKVELLTIKNETIKQIEQFMWEEYEKLDVQQEEIRKLDKDYINNIRYSFNYGQIQMIANLFTYFKKIKDYDEEE